MKRRTAIKGIVLFTLGTNLLYSCKDKYAAIKSLDLGYVKPTDAEIDLITDMADRVLPIQIIPGLQNHTTVPYTLKMVNDTHPADEREKFIKGYQEFNKFLQPKFNKTYSQLSDEEKDQLITELNESTDTVASEVVFFFKTLKSESIDYLVRSEYIQRNVRYYQIAPGVYNGCLQIEELTNKNAVKNG